MVKTYLRYSLKDTIGIITASNSNVIYDSKTKIAITSGIQDVLFWNVRTGVVEKRLQSEDVITYISKSNNSSLLAVGYSSGLIIIWDIEKLSSVVSFRGHNRAITSLIFDDKNGLLVSGSSDTNIIVWDLISESGLFKLKGHTSEITSTKLYNNNQYIISASKDGLVKIWEYETQHCVQTITGHRREVWSLCLFENKLITGSKDNHLRVYEYNQKPEELADVFVYKGYIVRTDAHRVVNIETSNNLMICQSSGKSVEIYKILTPEELKKKVNRQKKRQNEKKKKEGHPETNEKSEIYIQVQPLIVFTSKSKISWATISNSELCLSLINNIIEVQEIDINKEVSEMISQKNLVKLNGHRSDIRSLTLNKTNDILLSTCNEQIKLWDTNSNQTTKTMDCSYALCGGFLPGDNIIAVGLKTGNIHLYDINTGELIQDVKAHEGAVWSIAINPNLTGMSSGGADQQAIFWDISFSNKENFF